MSILVMWISYRLSPRGSGMGPSLFEKKVIDEKVTHDRTEVIFLQTSTYHPSFSPLVTLEYMHTRPGRPRGRIDPEIRVGSEMLRIQEGVEKRRGAGLDFHLQDPKKKYKITSPNPYLLPPSTSSYRLYRLEPSARLSFLILSATSPILCAIFALVAASTRRAWVLFRAEPKLLRALLRTTLVAVAATPTLLLLTATADVIAPRPVSKILRGLTVSRVFLGRAPMSLATSTVAKFTYFCGRIEVVLKGGVWCTCRGFVFAPVAVPSQTLFIWRK